MPQGNGLKNDVRDFWDSGSCGEVYASGDSEKEYYEQHRHSRYELEPYIPVFAEFENGKGKDVLEIGVGMGADHIEWAKSSPKSLSGVDLTPRAVEHTKKRLGVYGLESNVQVSDAENLPFEDSSFDIVYSWGVIHHSPDTPTCVNEIHRILRPGGKTYVMIYHKYSIVGYLLWIKYALMKGRPFMSLQEIYHKYLESPGTKAYTAKEAEEMFKNFSKADVKVMLSFGDLLEGAVGQRHNSSALSFAKKLWPRGLIKLLFKNHGLMLLIKAEK